MYSACVLWFPWPHLRSGVRQINQVDGIEYVATGAARELALKIPECRDGQHGGDPGLVSLIFTTTMVSLFGEGTSMLYLGRFNNNATALLGPWGQKTRTSTFIAWSQVVFVSYLAWLNRKSVLSLS